MSEITDIDPNAMQIEPSSGGQPGYLADPSIARQLGMFGPPQAALDVPVKRSTARVMTEIKGFATMAAQKYYYSWEVSNKNGTKSLVEGGSIKMANDLARIYGNCTVDTRVFDQGDSYLFYARFTDLETGYSLTRPFVQRKTQRLSDKMDIGRQEDIVLQIGASKAIRNVILNALQTFADYGLQEAKASVLNRVSKNMDGAREHILQRLDEYEVDVDLVSKHVGRPPDKWTAPDMARLYAQIQLLDDNMLNAEEAWPDPEAVLRSSSVEKGKSKLDQFTKDQGSGAEPPAKKKAGRPKKTEKDKTPQADADAPGHTPPADVASPEPAAGGGEGAAAGAPSAESAPPPSQGESPGAATPERDEAPSAPQAAGAPPPDETAGAANVVPAQEAAAPAGADLPGTGAEGDEPAAKPGSPSGGAAASASASPWAIDRAQYDNPGAYTMAMINALRTTKTGTQLNEFVGANHAGIEDLGGPGAMPYDMLQAAIKDQRGKVK